MLTAVRAVGVDACKSGWVAVLLDDGQVAGVAAGPTLTSLLAAWPGPAAVGVDMPLGLVAQGWRAPDLAARRLLAASGTRLRSRVFEVPPRPAWDEPGYGREAFARAVARCQALNGGKGFSIQAWGLKKKLLEANELYDSATVNLYEVHPELSFAALNHDVVTGGARPVEASKKTWTGQLTRRRLLVEAGIRLPENLGAAGLVPPDDILDAAAAAWSAVRIAGGTAKKLPGSAEGLPGALGTDGVTHDDKRREMAIRY